MFEYFTACKFKTEKDVSICMPPGQSESFQQALRSGKIDLLWKALADFNITNAKASVEEDRIKIMRLVQEEFGTEELNKAVASSYRAWMVSQAEAWAIQSQKECAKDLMQVGLLASRLNDKTSAAKHFEHALRMLMLASSAESEIGADICLRYGSLKGGARNVLTNRHN